MSPADCAQIDTILDGQGLSLSDEAIQHLDQCPQCRALYDWTRAKSPRASISPALSRRIADSLEASLPPVKPLAPRRVLIAEFIGLFVLLSAILTAVMGTAGIARASLTQIVEIGVLLLAGLYLFSTMLANLMRPGSYQPLPWHVVLAAIGLALLASMRMLFPWAPGSRFLSEGLPCLVSGVAIAAPAAVLLWLAVRRGAPLSVIATGGMLGATAGLVGVTTLQIKCQHQEAAHLLTWHWSVLLIAVCMGVFAGWLAQHVSDRSRKAR